MRQPTGDYYEVHEFAYDAGNVNAAGQTEYTRSLLGARANPVAANILVVAGGGGGGASKRENKQDCGGGGGAGGLISTTGISLSASVQYAVKVGGAGAAYGGSTGNNPAVLGTNQGHIGGTASGLGGNATYGSTDCVIYGGRIYAYFSIE